MFRRSDAPKKEKQEKSGGKRKKIIILAVILLVVAVFFIVKPLMQKKQTSEQMTAAVTRGNIVRTIEGSGVIEPIDQYTISALVTGEVLSDTFEEGDMVQKGDLLYVIDSSNIDSNIERAESSLKTARLSYDEALETLENQTVKAPIGGVITSLYVKEGDEIANGAKVAEIINSSRMILTIPFLASDAQSIFVGDTASVVPENAPSQKLSGTVRSVSTGSFTNTLGVHVSTVEILVDNPGAVQSGDRATAIIGTYACNEIGTFSYEDMKTVFVKTGGTVTNLSVMTGDRVNADMVLFTLTSDSVARSIERSRISYDDAVSGRDNAYEQLEDYQITAPISGKVTEKNVKAGDKLENGSGSNASSMAIIADLSILTFEMSVDELDITNIKEGQEVQVTADAVPGKLFIGHIKNVGINGVASNGVTSYPVTVELDGEKNADLLPGFNVNATVVVDSRENILMIPASAITRGNMVAVKGDAPKTDDKTKPEGVSKETSDNKHESDSIRVQNKAADRTSNMQAPEGFHYVRIETGITDGRYIEVISGLSEGDIVLLPQTFGNANSAVNFTPNAGSGMMGGMSGGMPMGGGMPSSGRSGMPGR